MNAFIQNCVLTVVLHCPNGKFNYVFCSQRAVSVRRAKPLIKTRHVTARYCILENPDLNQD